VAFSLIRPRHQPGREIEGFGVIARQQDAQSVPDTLRKVVDSGLATLMCNMYRWRTQSDLSKIEALRQLQIALALRPGQHTHSSGCRLYCID
jgi:hypothetical protein